MKILVTGGAGYIGSHACRALAAAGHLPVTFDNLSKGRRAAVRWGPFEAGDILDRDRLDAVFAAHAPGAVMHFAGAIEVAESVTNPGKYWRNNTAGSLMLAEAMVAAGCGRIVFSSTCAVYDEAAGGAGDLTEESPLGPVSPYASSKRAAEALLGDFSRGHGLQAVILRYFNVAGAAPGEGIGQRHRNATHIIPRLLVALEGGVPEMVINGGDYPTPDGTCVRDYIHVTDLATAHVAGLERLAGGQGGRVYNLGTGRGASVREVIETAMTVTGRQAPIRVGPRRAGDAVRLVSGSARARDELGWVPENSDLETILADAWAWHQAGGREL